MRARIFIVAEGGTHWIPMEESPYDQEVILQRALAEYPDLLPGDQINPENPCRWLLVRREMGVPADYEGGSVGSLDHLFLDQEAVPTFVECKRSSDARIRREVIGQMLDYAANGTMYWPMDRLRQAAAETAVANGRILDDQLRALLEDEDADLDLYWERVERNLRDGRIRLIFVADVIPRELRRLIEFLNGKLADVEVLGVEVRQFLGDKHRAIVPRVIGMTEAARTSKTGSAAPQWNEESFFAHLVENTSEGEVQVAQELLTWAKSNATRIYWGKGSRRGSFVPVLAHKGADHQLFAVFTSGVLEFYFQWYLYRAPFNSEDKRLEMLAKINAIPGINLPTDAISRRPSVPLSVFAEPLYLVELTRIFDWMTGEILAT